MRAFKVKRFHQWSRQEDIQDAALLHAFAEIEKGLVDANLGGNIYKKRVPLGSKGKRGGARTIVAFRHGDHAFFVYGFAKNRRANISDKELKALKLLATHLLGLGEKEIRLETKTGELIEVTNDG